MGKKKIDINTREDLFLSYYKEIEKNKFDLLKICSDKNFSKSNFLKAVHCLFSLSYFCKIKDENEEEEGKEEEINDYKVKKSTTGNYYRNSEGKLFKKSNEKDQIDDVSIFYKRLPTIQDFKDTYDKYENCLNSVYYIIRKIKLLHLEYFWEILASCYGTISFIKFFNIFSNEIFSPSENGDSVFIMVGKFFRRKVRAETHYDLIFLKIILANASIPMILKLGVKDIGRFTEKEDIIVSYYRNFSIIHSLRFDNVKEFALVYKTLKNNYPSKKKKKITLFEENGKINVKTSKKDLMLFEFVCKFDCVKIFKKYFLPKPQIINNNDNNEMLECISSGSYSGFDEKSKRKIRIFFSICCRQISPKILKCIVDYVKDDIGFLDLQNRQDIYIGDSAPEKVLFLNCFFGNHKEQRVIDFFNLLTSKSIIICNTIKEKPELYDYRYITLSTVDSTFYFSDSHKGADFGVYTDEINVIINNDDIDYDYIGDDDNDEEIEETKDYGSSSSDIDDFYNVFEPKASMIPNILDSCSLEILKAYIQNITGNGLFKISPSLFLAHDVTRLVRNPKPKTETVVKILEFINTISRLSELSTNGVPFTFLTNRFEIVTSIIMSLHDERSISNSVEPVQWLRALAPFVSNDEMKLIIYKVRTLYNYEPHSNGEIKYTELVRLFDVQYLLTKGKFSLSQFNGFETSIFLNPKLLDGTINSNILNSMIIKDKEKLDLKELFFKEKPLSEAELKEKFEIATKNEKELLDQLKKENDAEKLKKKNKLKKQKNQQQQQQAKQQAQQQKQQHQQNIQQNYENQHIEDQRKFNQQTKGRPISPSSIQNQNLNPTLLQNQNQTSNPTPNLESTKKATPTTTTTTTTNSNTSAIINEIKNQDLNQQQNITENINEIYDVSIGKFKFNKKESNILGRGSNGTLVFKGIWNNRIPVAIKQMQKMFNPLISKEIEILIGLTNKNLNLVGYIDQEEDENCVYLGLTLCDGSLQSLYDQSKLNEFINQNNNQNNNNNNNRVLDLIIGMINGVIFLHDQNIVHNDLNPRNILVKDNRLIISDLGLSKMNVSSTYNFSTNAIPTGQDGYHPVEVLLEKRKTKSVDVFSLGCLIYFIMTNGAHPFGDKFSRLRYITKSKYNLSQLSNLNLVATHLIELMISYDESKRPTLSSVLKHPLFWDSLKKIKFLESSLRLLGDHDFKKFNINKILISCNSNSSSSNSICNSSNSSSSSSSSISSSSCKISSSSCYCVPLPWNQSLDYQLVDSLSNQIEKKVASYKFDQLHDLIRFIRNTLQHYNQIYRDLKQILPNSDILESLKSQQSALNYFESKFPTLIIFLFNHFSAIPEIKNSIHFSNDTCSIF
ncbi:hypothetical protein DDB_G0288803 [Dictyostelium discoideum AX4]|uniref:Probable serine/threonine-protein kinase irlE n=1 Tax=Dictyostelium discoideum TaxID=44689 RepID=IRLE_DICDI|nr:hypothetical protein DDB_G0288803 [Dictyostelium discoideum AX4]Q54IE8.1 RecName: Full=Probable serine/threonine-protein kinase irlE; AltName: Full=Inositol-requiring protein-like protein kinase E [Dictyostelium discoideum]EAL63023.1 hypothetical protein DDB_G0288803 [Dictyostelium discoideum AX4]|eukprot:XP_636529.1 hypothetical protein DDB_G0288803 [Dictyostelium discoideum AX4]